MNRDEFLDSALGLIAKGDDAHPPMAMACYLGAIAKLWLAQALGRDASASPPDHGGTVLDSDLLAKQLADARRYHCGRCHRNLSECVCEPPL